MQLADVLVVGLAGAVVQRCGRRPLGALVHSDGPPVLCVVIGMPQGRWHAELTGVSPAARECRRLLTIANGVTTVSDVSVDAPATLGLAVLLGWRFCAWHEWAPTHLGHDSECPCMSQASTRCALLGACCFAMRAAGYAVGRGRSALATAAGAVGIHAYASSG